MNLRHNQSLQVHEFIDQLSDTCNRLTNDYFTKLSLSIVQHCNAVKNHSPKSFRYHVWDKFY